MSTRARAEKGRFITGSTEFDIIPQKWRQEWVTRPVQTKDGKAETNMSFKTFCWVPVKEPESTETPGKASEQGVEDKPVMSASTGDPAVAENS
ncbi:uncharacterized protein T551_01403 [Pneumocystis jirovecii RU7]|uniref:Uncharacterized protein n=1 Tax=Pneumocystis jirovecii (strain RU7) TaxID=1408657 RepID=A0A0W4ZSJ5_PNEJ7|nr:uncharacterized protein T551_01403 [Pneumocystis jirovecii RU7]KTW31331.1 hypothetical protein T551_01403 [Pneumocystis jirovecii RU7]